MIFKKQFIPHLLGCLKTKEYVLFEHFVLNQTQPDLNLNILLRKKDVHSVIESIKEFSHLKSINVSNKNEETTSSLIFDDDAQVQINFIHDFIFNGTIYMEKEMIFTKRQKSDSDFYMPNIEHLFEYAVLSHFLNQVGLNEQYQSYFEDFHFFVKEGLVDFFNEKYRTKFSSVYAMTIYDENIRLSIIEEIKNLPSNKFLNKMNIRWHNFIENVREARIF